jgi:hypothetical protein
MDWCSANMAARRSDGLPTVGEDPPLTLAEQRARAIAELLYPSQEAHVARQQVVSAVLQGNHGHSRITDHQQVTLS